MIVLGPCRRRRLMLRKKLRRNWRNRVWRRMTVGLLSKVLRLAIGPLLKVRNMLDLVKKLRLIIFSPYPFR